MTKDQILAALENVVDPCSKAMGRPMSIVELGLIDGEGVQIRDDRVEVGLVLTEPSCAFFRNLSSWIEAELLALGVREVTVTTRAELWVPSRMRTRGSGDDAGQPQPAPAGT